jgi:hypothetical protein
MGKVFPWMLAILGILAASALWAPHQARIAGRFADLLALALLVVATITLTGADPEGSARLLLRLSAGAGLIYAVAGIATGAGLQGRSSAFGSEPNVYVRVVSEAAIACAALAFATKRRWPLFGIPIMCVAALLSGSRGGLVALIVAGAAFALVYYRPRRPAVLLGSGLGAFAFVFVIWRFITARASTLVEQRYSLG